MSHDELPHDYPERSAYMRLYRSYKLGESCWHRTAFGAEINTLIERGHAVTAGSGYCLTQAGIAHWQRCVQEWAGTAPDSVDRTT